MSKNSYNYSLQDLWGCLTVKVKFPVKNVEIVRKLSVLASSSSQTQGFDRILKIFIKSLFFIKLEVNDDKTGLLFVPLSTLSKPEGTHHPLSIVASKYGKIANKEILSIINSIHQRRKNLDHPKLCDYACVKPYHRKTIKLGGVPCWQSDLGPWDHN